MRDCVKKHRFMKPVKLFYLKNCPFCKKALRYIEEAKAAHPELAEVEIEMIEESEQPGVADGFDYYYVPTFYVDGEKDFPPFEEGKSVHIISQGNLLIEYELMKENKTVCEQS